MNNTNKNDLFSMMSKINNDFIIKENNQQLTSQDPSMKRMATDVKSMQRATNTATSVQTANKRINTTTEFPEAFKIWFQTLGYKPENPAITISRVVTEIKRVMQELGYK